MMLKLPHLWLIAGALCALLLSAACSGPVETTGAAPQPSTTPQPTEPASTPTPPPPIPTATETPPSPTPPPLPTETPAPTEPPSPSPTPAPTETPAPPPPTPEPPPASAALDDLGLELQALIDGWAGDNAAAVLDLQTGATVGVNGDRQQLAACTLKIFIMMAVAEDLEAGRYTGADIADLVQSAMGPSNTWPARELLRYVGDGDVGDGVLRVNAIMQSLGMSESVLAHPPGYPEEDYGLGDSNLVTANDLNRALAQLWRGEALSPWATDYVLWSMTLAIPGQQYSLGGGIPDDAALFHKIGLLYAPYNTWNDSGIVTFERDGETYAYAITYLGSYAADWKDAYYHGTDVSWVTWQTMSALYP